jgi:hypothetical protein
MLLSEIFTLIYRKIHISAFIFLITFLLVSQFDFFEKKFISKRNVIIGSHMGSSNFPQIDVMVSVINGQQFKADLGDVSAKLKSSTGGLIVSFKGNNPESLIAASEIWIKSINKIEEDLFREESYQLHNSDIERLNKEINYYKNYKIRFSSTNQTLSEVALVNILNDKREVENWNNLHASELALKKIFRKKVFVPTKYYLDHKGQLSYYFPNNIVFIGISLMSTVFYLLLIIGLSYRKRS